MHGDGAGAHKRGFGAVEGVPPVFAPPLGAPGANGKRTFQGPAGVNMAGMAAAGYNPYAAAAAMG